MYNYMMAIPRRFISGTTVLTYLLLASLCQLTHFIISDKNYKNTVLHWCHYTKIIALKTWRMCMEQLWGISGNVLLILEK